MPSLALGSSGSSVRNLQASLKSAGFYLGTVDGKFGNGTKVAVERFQQAKHLTADGKAGPQTQAALSRSSDTFTNGTNNVSDGGSSGHPANGVAKIDHQKSGPGLVQGKLTVNGHTYDFKSGRGNLFSTPKGEYRVVRHLNSRSESAFSRGGVGFSFRLEDARRPGSDAMYDRRAGRDRRYLPRAP